MKQKRKKCDSKEWFKKLGLWDWNDVSPVRVNSHCSSRAWFPAPTSGQTSTDDSAVVDSTLWSPRDLMCTYMHTDI